MSWHPMAVVCRQPWVAAPPFGVRLGALQTCQLVPVIWAHRCCSDSCRTAAALHAVMGLSIIALRLQDIVCAWHGMHSTQMVGSQQLSHWCRAQQQHAAAAGSIAGIYGQQHRPLGSGWGLGRHVSRCLSVGLSHAEAACLLVQGMLWLA